MRGGRCGANSGILPLLVGRVELSDLALMVPASTSTSMRLGRTSWMVPLEPVKAAPADSNRSVAASPAPDRRGSYLVLREAGQRPRGRGPGHQPHRRLAGADVAVELAGSASSGSASWSPSGTGIRPRARSPAAATPFVAWPRQPLDDSAERGRDFGDDPGSSAGSFWRHARSGISCHGAGIGLRSASCGGRLPSRAISRPTAQRRLPGRSADAGRGSPRRRSDGPPRPRASARDRHAGGRPSRLVRPLPVAFAPAQASAAGWSTEPLDLAPLDGRRRSRPALSAAQRAPRLARARRHGRELMVKPGRIEATLSRAILTGGVVQGAPGLGRGRFGPRSAGARLVRAPGRRRPPRRFSSQNGWMAPTRRRANSFWKARASLQRTWFAKAMGARRSPSGQAS